MLVSIGSMSEPLSDLQSGWGKHPLGASLGPETDRAAVMAFDPDGNRIGTFATGLRHGLVLK
jgi:hypothetical protein